MYLFGLIVFLLKIWVSHATYSVWQVIAGVLVLWGSNTLLIIGVGMGFSSWETRRFKAGKRPLERAAEWRAALTVLMIVVAIWIALQFMTHSQPYFTV